MGKLIKDLNKILNIYIIIMILTIMIVKSYNPDAVYTYSNVSATIVTKGLSTEKIIALSFDD